MNTVSERVLAAAKQLGFEEVGSRTFQTVAAFIESLDRELDEKALKAEFLNFEEHYLDLSLLEECDLPGGLIDLESQMNTQISTVSADESVSSLAKMLLRRMITGMPVVDAEGKLIGVVSTTDIVGAIGRPDRLAEFEELKVRDIMTTYTLTVTLKSDLAEVLHYMTSFRLHRIFVVDEGRRPIGIITSLDAVRILRRVLVELRSQTLR